MILRYSGGKYSAAQDLLRFAPRDFTEFREPFVGGCNMIWFVAPDKRFWLNDVDPDLMKFWFALRNDPSLIDRLLDQKAKCTTADATGLEYAKAKFRFLRSGDPVAFHLLNRYAYGQFVKRGRSNVASFSWGHLSNGLRCVTREKLEYAATRLRSSKLTCEHYSKLLDAPGDGVFLYLDPPYYIGERHHGSALYQYEFSIKDHWEFAHRLLGCKHRFLLTYGWNELSCRFIRLWKKHGFQIEYREYNYTSQMNSRLRTNGSAVELVIRNY